MPNPTRFNPTRALELWREALAEELGVTFPTKPADIDRILPIMYEVRKPFPELQELMLCVGPRGEEIMIVKKSVEAP